MPEEPNGNRHLGSGPPRVGLVLGAGGILGGAWLTGALHALAEAAGWDPRTSHYIVGTSAGSVIGSLVASGVPTSFLVHHQRGGSTEGMYGAEGHPIEDADSTSRRLFAWDGTVPRPVLGSVPLIVRSALQPWRFPPTAAIVGWVGRGFLATDEIGRIVRWIVPEGWPSHPNLWIVAVDYATGRRMVFGGPEAPATDLDRAVEASCAIPGFYRPVEIEGRLYIDGGAWSPSNIDLLARTDADVVVGLNPMSTLHPGIPTTLLERVERRVRRLTGRRLGRETRKLRAAGKQVLLVQPRERDLEAMGLNLMNPQRRTLVCDTALETTRERLQEPDAREVLAELRRRSPSPSVHSVE